MDHIDTLIQHWSAAAGVSLDDTSQHVSSSLAKDDPWRRLQRSDLTPEALVALERFYAADWAFLRLAQQVFGEWPAA